MEILFWTGLGITFLIFNVVYWLNQDTKKKRIKRTQEWLDSLNKGV